ncbi:DUF3263 domain-containing protein [Rhodococcus indonesiensis]
MTRTWPARPALSSDERLLVDFAIRWCPYGGPSAADILVEFGMTPQRYGQVLESLLNSPTLAALDPALRRRLHAQCTSPRPGSGFL